jgi:hypothetical protein
MSKYFSKDLSMVKVLNETPVVHVTILFSNLIFKKTEDISLAGTVVPDNVISFSVASLVIVRINFILTGVFFPLMILKKTDFILPQDTKGRTVSSISKKSLLLRPFIVKVQYELTSPSTNKNASKVSPDRKELIKFLVSFIVNEIIITPKKLKI